MLKRTLLSLVVAVLTLASSGCGYSLAGRGTFLPPYIKRIGVPMFVNNSGVFDVERRVTQRVQTEFIGRGKYTIVPDSTGVDALLSGEISSITLAPAAFNTQQQATRYALTLTAKVEFKDLTTNKVLWQNPSMQYREEFDVSSTTNSLDPTAFFGQDVNALDRMANEFARALVSAILEAF
jgi:Lipopolysaccharide-assembly